MATQILPPVNREFAMLRDMTIQRMDNVGIVVDDLQAAIGHWSTYENAPEVNHLMPEFFEREASP